jgi:hypothetical protein
MVMESPTTVAPCKESKLEPVRRYMWTRIKFGLRRGKENVTVLVVPASAVNEITYGQDVHRRVGAAIGWQSSPLASVD